MKSHANSKRQIQRPIFAEERYPIIVPPANMMLQQQMNSLGNTNYLRTNAHDTQSLNYSYYLQDNRKLQPIFPIGLSNKQYGGKPIIQI